MTVDSGNDLESQIAEWRAYVRRRQALSQPGRWDRARRRDQLAPNPNRPPPLVLPNQVHVRNRDAPPMRPGLHEMNFAQHRIAHLPVRVPHPHEIGPERQPGQ